MNKRNLIYKVSDYHTPFPHTQFHPFLCVEYGPYGPPTLVCPFITVIKYLSKATGSGEGLPPLTGYSPSLMEVRLYPLLWGVPGRNLRARTEAEAMKEYCLLVYSLWLARPDFLYHQDHLSRVALPRGGWILFNQSSIKKNAQTCLQASWMTSLDD